SAQEAAIGWLSEHVYDDVQVDEMIEARAVPPVQATEDQLWQSEEADFLCFSFGLAIDAANFELSWQLALQRAAAQELLSNLSQILLLEITPEQFVDIMNATL